MPIKINKIDITHEELSKIFIYDGRNLLWRNTLGPKIIKNKKAGFINDSGYIVVGYKNKLYRAHRIIYYMLTGINSTEQIDHLNKDRIDNRIENLRISNQSSNQINAGIKSNNKSGVTGVCYDKSRGKWVVQIQDKNKKSIRKRFLSFRDAVEYRYKLEKELSHYSVQTKSSAFEWLENNKLKIEVL